MLFSDNLELGGDLLPTSLHGFDDITDLVLLVVSDERYSMALVSGTTSTTDSVKVGLFLFRRVEKDDSGDLVLEKI